MLLRQHASYTCKHKKQQQKTVYLVTVCKTQNKGSLALGAKDQKIFLFCKYKLLKLVIPITFNILIASRDLNRDWGFIAAEVETV